VPTELTSAHSQPHWNVPSTAGLPAWCRMVCLPPMVLAMASGWVKDQSGITQHEFHFDRNMNRRKQRQRRCWFIFDRKIDDKNMASIFLSSIFLSVVLAGVDRARQGITLLVVRYPPPLEFMCRFREYGTQRSVALPC